MSGRVWSLAENIRPSRVYRLARKIGLKIWEWAGITRPGQRELKRVISARWAVKTQ